MAQAARSRGTRGSRAPRGRVAPTSSLDGCLFWRSSMFRLPWIWQQTWTPTRRRMRTTTFLLLLVEPATSLRHAQPRCCGRRRVVSGLAALGMNGVGRTDGSIHPPSFLPSFLPTDRASQPAGRQTSSYLPRKQASQPTSWQTAGRPGARPTCKRCMYERARAYLSIYLLEDGWSRRKKEEIPSSQPTY